MTDQPRSRDDDTWRGIELERISVSRYLARNARGGELVVSSQDDSDFTPVELLLVALAACGAVNVDELTSRRAEPEVFTVSAEGHKIRDDGGGHMVDLQVSFATRFPDGPDGDRAREFLPRAMQQTHDRICTVSRTVELGEAVAYAATEVPRR
jgi:putative redox protein